MAVTDVRIICQVVKNSNYKYVSVDNCGHSRNKWKKNKMTAKIENIKWNQREIIQSVNIIIEIHNLSVLPVVDWRQ